MAARPRIFFVIHNAESFAAHPDMIGFAAKVDQNGKIRRDENGEIMPTNSRVNQLKAGDIIVYYTLRDHLIRGFYRINERLSESDPRRAEDWGDTIQFLIEPLSPRVDMDFRKLVYSKARTLNMFSNLTNPRRQWGMSIRGFHSIQEIDYHDLEIIASELPSAQVPQLFRRRLGLQTITKSRNLPLNPQKLRIEGLDPYELVTLFSLSEGRFGKNDVVFTKSGGFWPMLLADLSLRYDFDDRDVEWAARRAGRYYLDLAHRWSYRDGVRKVEDGVIRTFLTALLGDEAPGATDFLGGIEQYLAQIEIEYDRALKRLSSEGLIEDPIGWLGLLVIGLVPYAFSMETNKGGEKVRRIRAIFWEYEHKMGVDNESTNFNFKLINQLRKFVLGFVQS